MKDPVFVPFLGASREQLAGSLCGTRHEWPFWLTQPGVQLWCGENKHNPQKALQLVLAGFPPRSVTPIHPAQGVGERLEKAATDARRCPPAQEAACCKPGLEWLTGPHAAFIAPRPASPPALCQSRPGAVPSGVGLVPIRGRRAGRAEPWAGLCSPPTPGPGTAAAREQGATGWPDVRHPLGTRPRPEAAHGGDWTGRPLAQQSGEGAGGGWWVQCNPWWTVSKGGGRSRRRAGGGDRSHFSPSRG